jgi:acyl transferase domain-containing protein
MEPIAIVGFAFKLPQDAEDTQSFWDMLKEGRNVKTDWPESRINIDAFHDPDPKKLHTVRTPPVVLRF